MANRYTLAISKLDDFKEWLIKDGWEIKEPKAVCEVFRAEKEGRKNPLMIFKRHRASMHLSVMDRDMGVVGAYLRDRRNATVK